MKCPKCGAGVVDGAEECQACGIVFSRWRERPQRPTFDAVSVPPPVSAPAEQRTPTLLVIGGIVVFMFFGLLWTMHRRAARDEKPHDDLTPMLDEINQSHKSQRDRLSDEAASAARAEAHDQALQAAAAAKAGKALPPGLTEEGVRALVEQDAFFQVSAVANVPKEFTIRDYERVRSKYPALVPAANEQLIEFDPPFNVKRPPDPAPGMNQSFEVRIPSAAYYKVAMIRDRDAEYEIDVGLRRIDKLTIDAADDFKIDASFTFTYEHPVGIVLKVDHSRSGHATLRRGASGWRVDAISH
jgi:hypothetical protein